MLVYVYDAKFDIRNKEVSVWQPKFRLRRGPEVALSEVRRAFYKELIMKITCPAMSMASLEH